MRWEYVVTEVVGGEQRILWYLNDRGSRGWELVAVDGRYCYMKRPIKEERRGESDPDPATGAGQGAGDGPVLPVRGQGQ